MIWSKTLALETSVNYVIIEWKRYLNLYGCDQDSNLIPDEPQYFDVKVYF